MRFKDKLKRSISRPIVLDKNRNINKEHVFKNQPTTSVNWGGISKEAKENSDRKHSLFKFRPAGVIKSDRKSFKSSDKYKRKCSQKNKHYGSTKYEILGSHGHDLRNSKRLCNQAVIKNKLSVTIPSCRKITTETVDLSSLVKQVEWPQKGKQKYLKITSGYKNDFHTRSENLVYKDRVNTNVGNEVKIKPGSRQGNSVEGKTTHVCINQDQPDKKIKKKEMAEYNEVASILSRELSPTCSDIYGNDEMDNVTFGFCSNLAQNQEKSIANKTKNKQEISQPDCSNKTEISKTSDIGYENPWVLQQHMNGDHANVNDNENYCEVELVNKNKKWLDTIEQDEMYNSFGFDVSHDISVHEIPNRNDQEDLTKDEMTRSKSADSLNSFGSSIHSAHSNELFFSDSEAEHDMDQLNNLHIEKSEPKKQLIPYSLREENSEGSITPRKKSKGLNSKSIEEKINEIAKQVFQFIDGKEDEADFVKKEAVKQSKSFDGSFTLDSDKIGKIKKAKHNRRSLDSTFGDKESLNNLDDLGKRKSMLASSTELLLKPVLEAESKVTEKMIEPKDSKLDDSKKFYTLPNPRKRKSTRRKSSRLESISKMVSEKAHSLTNLKLGSSFKLRRDDESESSWGQLSISANSLANMMVKTASNFSTLIRKRSNSNTATDVADSPFKQYVKKRTKPKDDEPKTELAYEKVLVTVPRKRAVTAQEQKSMSKKLKLNIEIAEKSRNCEFNSTGSVSRTSSFVQDLQESGSQSPLHSPTLFDEIMKSVDPESIHRLCSTVDDNDELSSDCDSSSGSSIFLFQKRYSLESDLSEVKSNRDSLMMTFCRVCGRLKSVSDGSTDSSDGDVVLSPRHAISLCDLTAMCQCIKRKTIQKKDAKHKENEQRKSWAIVGDGDSTEGHGELFKFSSCSKTCAKSQSVGDLRLCKNSETLVKDTNDLANKSAERKKKISSIPGLLQRQEPLLDLSADSLDKTVDSETGLPIDDEKRSYSCGSLNGYKQNHSCQNEKAYDLSLSSCTDKTDTSNNCPKSHSCGDLLESSDLIVSDQLCKNDNEKKEIRKLKVKSLSSSHDVLNQFGQMDKKDLEDIENVIFKTKDTEKDSDLKEKCDTGEKEIGFNDDNEADDMSKGLEIKPNGILEDAEATKVSCDSDRKVLREIKTEKSSYIPNVIIETEPKVTSKPPLPFTKTHKHFLSMSELNMKENKENLTAENKMFKRHSVGAFVSNVLDNMEDMKTVCECKSVRCDTDKPKSRAEKFLFDEKTIKAHLNQQSNSLKMGRKKSLSTDDIKGLEKLAAISRRQKLASIHSMNRLSEESFLDDVFPQFSVPNELPYPLSDPFKVKSPGVVSPGFEGQGLSDFGEESVYKFDVCLGYLLHSVECGDKTICVYSLQRNKQFMESMITPLAALPGREY